MSALRVVALCLLSAICSAPCAPSPLPELPVDSLRAPQVTYRWPIEGEHIVTSTFGEYRRTHFHAGIDISTGDATDYRVGAAGDGYVSRIRVMPVGYGKILYVRHSDGYTTTYAHLARFAPQIESRAELEQTKAGHYGIDIQCGQTDFPVHAGDLIAFSGESGTRSPHLHFEIHDESGNPVNPFLFPPLQIHDTIAPRVRGIAVSPLHPGATVDGAPGARLYRATPHDGTCVIGKPIVVTGEVGFSVDARDRIPGSRYTNGVYAESLTIDSTLCFSSRLDRTPWEEAHEIGLCYEPADRVGRSGRYAKLYMDSPNHLPFYAPRIERAGIIDESRFTPGVHRFRIICSDFSGNSETVVGTLIVSRMPGFTIRSVAESLYVHIFNPADARRILLGVRSPGANWSIRTFELGEGASDDVRLPVNLPGNLTARVQLENHWGTISSPQYLVPPATMSSPPSFSLSCESGTDYVEVRAKSDRSFCSPPVVTMTEGSARSSIVMEALDTDEYLGWVRPRASFQGVRHVTGDASYCAGRATASSEFALYPIIPGTRGTITFDRGRLSITYDSLSVLKPLLLQVNKSEGEDGPLYALSPADVVLGDGLTVAMDPDTVRPHQALFARSGSSWQLIGTPREGVGAARTGRMSGRLGEVTLLVDDNAPVISRLTIRQIGALQPRIEFRFRDDLSGVEYDDLKMYIDKVPVIPEIDGLRHRALYQVKEPLARGSHQLTIRLFDRMGNSSTAERRFVLR